MTIAQFFVLFKCIHIWIGCRTHPPHPEQKCSLERRVQRTATVLYARLCYIPNQFPLDWMSFGHAYSHSRPHVTQYWLNTFFFTAVYILRLDGRHNHQTREEKPTSCAAHTQTAPNFNKKKKKWEILNKYGSSSRVAAFLWNWILCFLIAILSKQWKKCE